MHIVLLMTFVKKKKKTFFYEVQVKMDSFVGLPNVSGSMCKRQNDFVFICCETALGWLKAAAQKMKAEQT